MIFREKDTYEIIGAAMYVYKSLREGFLEAVYQEALEIEFKKRGIPCEPQKELTIYYEGQPLSKKYYPDFVCYGDLIVEIKAVKELDDSHRSQLFNYLKATNSKVGLLLNFGHYNGLQWERKVR